MIVAGVMEGALPEEAWPGQPDEGIEAVIILLQCRVEREATRLTSVREITRARIAS